MKITVCGSMVNYPKMVILKERLSRLGHDILLPDPLEKSHNEDIDKGTYVDTYSHKIKYDLIRKYYDNIVKSDCVLIANYDKNGIQNYIGGNAFLEIGFAHILKKPIYLINNIPDIDVFYNEIVAMQPIVINNDLTLIKSISK